MSVWKWEMGMCCRMHIESLYKLLSELKDRDVSSGIVVHPDYYATPFNDTLFDSIMLYAKSIDNGKIEISGTVFYWTPGTEGWKKSTVIRTFPNLDESLAWLSNKDAARDECTELFYERCK